MGGAHNTIMFFLPLNQRPEAVFLLVLSSGVEVEVGSGVGMRDGGSRGVGVVMGTAVFLIV